MRGLPCPHCYERPSSLDMHLRFECPKLIGRSRYVDPVTAALPQFFEDVEKLLDIAAQ